LRQGSERIKIALTNTSADFKELAVAADGFSENFSSFVPE